MEGTTICPDADPIQGKCQHKEKVTDYVGERNCNCQEGKMRGERRPRKERRENEPVFLKDKSYPTLEQG